MKKLTKLLALPFILLCLASCDAADPAETTDIPETAETETIPAETEAAVTETEPAACHSYVFANPEDAAVWAGSQAEITYEFGTMKLTPTGHDPILSRTFTEEEQFSADEYSYVAYRYKADCTLDKGVFFVTSTNHPEFHDNGLTFFDVNTGNTWTNVIQPMSQNAFWEDTITAFRIDPINGGTLDEGAVIWIDRIGFFRTYKEAQAFLQSAVDPAENPSSVTIRKGMTKVFAPKGRLQPDYAAADYLPADPAAVSSENNVAAVTIDGVQRVVPISYVNTVGFLSYMAEVPGEYMGIVLADPHTRQDIPDTVSEEDYHFVVTVRGILSHEDCAAETVTRGQFADALQNTLLVPMNHILFAPQNADDPLTRADAAEMVGTYLDLLGASPYADPDYYPTDCTLTDAGNLACGSGVVTVTDGKLSPDATLNGGELASLMRRLVLAVLDQPVLPSRIDTDEKIRIAGWSNFSWGVDEETIKTFADAGLNLMISTGDIERDGFLQTALNASAKYGVEILRYNYSPWNFDPAAPAALPASCFEYFDAPAYLGNFIFDEPGTDHYPMMAALTEFYNKTMPGKLCYYNLLPLYANAAQLKFGANAAAIEYYDADPNLYQKYVEAYAEQIPGDYMCVDIYPNRVSGGKKSTYKEYLKNMDIFAEACRKYDRDFWLYVQTTGLDGTRVPDYADMRWQMYIGLSFGVKTFLHFTYGTYQNNWTDSMVTNGEPTSVYYAAQKANLEIMALSDDYVRYKNLGAYTHKASRCEYARFDNQYKDFTVLTGIESEDPLLIGCFEAEDGDGYAFTVVNLYDLYREKDASLQFTLDGDYTVTAWIRGEKVTLEPTDGQYSLELECAEGVFVEVRDKK